jgi:dihydroorotate dehydrogenase electron transfer subunit
VDAVSESAVLESVERVAGGLTRLRLMAPGICERAAPGQFVMLGPLSADHQDPFLNRPLSIHRCPGGGALDLLVAEVGRGTRLMVSWTSGHRVDLMGPLGSGFCGLDDEQDWLLVAGGVGVAPLFFLAETLRAKPRACRLLYGAVDAAHLVPSQLLSELGCQIELATDDGSAGSHGLVTDLLAPHLRRAAADQAAPRVAACGPLPMLRAVAEACRAAQVPAQLSLENRMACGTGACMGCVDQVAGRPQRVCVEGPVFDALEVFP